MVTVNIIDFIEHRLTEEEHAATEMPDMAKHLRIIDGLRAACSGIVLYFEQHPDETIIDNPLAAGLLPIAGVWSDHPDFAVAVWFPRMSKVGA